MEQRTFRLMLSKNLIYTLLVLLCYVVQETPGLASLWDIRPTIVIGAVVAIAMIEGEFSGALFGLLGGILCDTAAFHLFGIATMLFLVLGCAVVLNFILGGEEPANPGSKMAIDLTSSGDQTTLKPDEVQDYLRGLGIEGVMTYHNRQESFVRFD